MNPLFLKRVGLLVQRLNKYITHDNVEVDPFPEIVEPASWPVPPITRMTSNADQSLWLYLTLEFKSPEHVTIELRLEDPKAMKRDDKAGIGLTLHIKEGKADTWASFVTVEPADHKDLQQFTWEGRVGFNGNWLCVEALLLVVGRKGDIPFPPRSPGEALLMQYPGFTPNP